MSSKKRSSVSKDKLSLRMGLFVLVLFLELFIGIDTEGWGVKTNTFAEISRSAITISNNYECLCHLIFMSPIMYARQALFLLNNGNHSTNHV